MLFRSRIDTSGLPVGASGTLVIYGYALDAVTGISMNPGTGVTLGAPQISPDGTQLTVSVTVAEDAPAGWREVTLATASGTVTFSDTSKGRFYVGAGLPMFSSISPILGTQGGVLTLTINGSNFQDATAVTITPSDGIMVGGGMTVNATGTQITVPIAITADAPTTARVIQVVTPAGVSSSVASPANTFTVYPP